MIDLQFLISGTMVTIEGPRFSSKAESHMFRSWGGDVINMTTVPEVSNMYTMLNFLLIAFLVVVKMSKNI